MKIFILVFAFSSISFASETAQRGVSALLGEQIAVLEDIKELTEKRQFGQIYDLLAPDYADGIDRDTFIAKSKSLDWRIDVLEFGTLERFKEIAFVPIEAVVIKGDREARMHTVVFFRRTEDGWRLLNFPFLRPDLPSFLAIPPWFLRGS